jgi:hypothetical protein
MILNTSFDPGSVCKLLKRVYKVVKPEYYNRSINTVILQLLSSVRIASLVIEAHRRHLKEYRMTQK